MSKQNLVKGKFPYIDMFDHEGLVVISAMRDLIFGVFYHLEINYPMDVVKGISYKQRILRGADL